MNILVLNSGSSSIKFSIFATGSNDSADDPASILEGELSGIGGPSATLKITPEPAQPLTSWPAGSPVEAIDLVLDELSKPGLPEFNAVGYRVVHPGPRLNRHQRITQQVLAELEAAAAFAPLHDPEAVALIRAVMARFPAIPHFACFDTIFHQTMPPEATTYPIPRALRDRGVHRYGFHGLSCESVVDQLRRAPGLGLPRCLIIAHLGSGSSVTAVIEGASVDTSMGLTPTGGVVMGTRPGDLDPGLIFYLLRQPGSSVETVERMLNHDAGLKALSGSSDMRTLREASPGDANARLAIEVFLRSVRRTIGGMAALHGMDALVFTGGIGEHDAITRARLGGGYCGEQPELEDAANDAPLQGMRKISAEGSNVAVFVVPAQEDLMIARHVARLAAKEPF